MTIVDFILARIAEDEAATKAAVEVNGADAMLAALPIALFDGLRVAFPVRVLAECEAKRRIVELHTSDDGDGDDCPLCSEWHITKGGCDTLRALASVYADHSDFAMLDNGPHVRRI